MPTGIKYANDLLPDVRLEPTARRIRAIVGDQTVADTTEAFVLFERDRLPVYYMPKSALTERFVVASDHRTECPRKGTARYAHLHVGDRRIDNAVWSYPHPPDHLPELADLAAVSWDAVDHWLEEDEEVYKHARDPYHRVDAMQSSRHVQVLVDGEMIADTRRPTLLFETGLPTRFYIPKLDVRHEVLAPSDTTSVCPYKGTAHYWSVTVGDRTIADAVWSYPTPVAEAPKITNLLCFFDERIDEVIVDGVSQPKPATPWS